MKKQIIWYLFFLLVATEVSTKQPVCISLGDACGPALMLRDLGIREEAFPFDWVLSPFKALYGALRSDFSHFLTQLTMRSDKTGVSDYYGFHFTHDWPTVHNPYIDALNLDFTGNCKLFSEWEKALPLVRTKYQRRIERLKTICLSEDKIIFIRSGNFAMPKEEAMMIRDFFAETYPNLDFLLVVISFKKEFVEPWGIDGIKNFYLKEWRDSVGFAHILQQVDPAFNGLAKKSIIIDEQCMSCEH